MSAEILEKLALLNEQELIKVYKLINKLAAKHTGQKVDRTPQPAPAKQIEVDYSKPVNFKGRREAKREELSYADKRVQEVRGKRHVGDVQARKEKMVITTQRENKFFQLRDNKGNLIADSSKEDVEIDRLLAKKQPVPRVRDSNLVDVECVGGCDGVYTISMDMLGEESAGYVCNSCALRRKG